MLKIFRDDFVDNLHMICKSLKEGKTYQMFSTIEFNYKFDGTKLTIDGPTHSYYKVEPYVIVHDSANGKIIFNDKYLDSSTYKFFYKAIREVRENLEKRQADEELIRQKKKEFHEKFPLEVLNDPNRYTRDISPRSSGSSSSSGNSRRRSGDVNTDIFWSSVSDSSSCSDSRSSSGGKNSDD